MILVIKEKIIRIESIILKKILFKNNLMSAINEKEKINLNDESEDVNINCNISMILYALLVFIKSDIKNSNNNNKIENLEMTSYILNYLPNLYQIIQN